MPQQPNSLRLPWLVRFVFERATPEALREEMLGDLVEGFERRLTRADERAARRWAYRQLLALRPWQLRRSAGWIRRGPTSNDSRGQGRGGVLSSDLTHAARLLFRNRGPAAVVVLTIALAVAATTSVFSVVNGVLLTPLPYPEPERLVRVWQIKNDWIDSPNHQLRSFSLNFPLSVPTFEDWLAEDLGFDALGAYSSARFVRQTPEGAELVAGQVVTAGTMEALGIQPLLGRLLVPADDARGAARVAVLSHTLWQESFGARRDVLGEALVLDGVPHTIVGVMPKHFRALDGDARIWTPLADDDNRSERDSQFLSVVARLAPGVDRAMAEDRLAAVQTRLAEAYPDSSSDLGSRMEGLLEWMVGDVRSTLWFLLGAVILVLAIASANIANLLSVAGLSRRHELAVKAALGASSGRLVRGLFLEALLLALLGGAAGILLAWVTLPVLLRVLPASVPRHEQIGIDPTVLAFALAVTLLTALAAGVLPALQSTRIARGLRAGGRSGSEDRRGGRVRAGLVVVEVALASVLLIGAYLLGVSFHRLWSVDRGFATESLAVLSVTPDEQAYPDYEDRDRFVVQLRDELATIPGVEVSASNQVPMSGSTSSTTYEVERPEGEPEKVSVLINVVLENYFDVLRIPILQGRGLEATDDGPSPPVAVVNESLARALWPGDSPLGKRLRPSRESSNEAEWTTVVGLVPDVRHSSLAVADEVQLYVPVWQDHRHPDQWVLRARGDLDGVLELARSSVSRVSATTPVRWVEVIEQHIADSVAVHRFRSLFIIGLGTMAALLALLGVYGVMAFSVQQQTREIGVRIALGARTTQVVGHVLGSGLRLAVVGALVGAAAALALAGTISGFLYEIEATDPRSYVVVVLTVVGVCAVAGFLPARRASSIDPAKVLGSD